jgi:hypothetical protein
MADENKGAVMPTAMFDRRHQDYAEKVAHWNFLEQTYFGGRKWFETNIHKYFREGDKEFDDRRNRAYRFNHTREIVDLVTKYVFKASPFRKMDDAPAPVEDFWKSATRGGLDIDALMRQVSQMTSIYGQPYIVVDNTLRLDQPGPISVADMKKAGSKVYAYCVAPQDAIDMSFDEFGILNWILFKESTVSKDSFFENHVGKVKYRLWTRDAWFLFESREARHKDFKKITPTGATDGVPVFRASSQQTKTANETVVELIDSGEHGLGRVPVIVPRERHSESKYSAPGMIDDIAYLDRAVANYLSNLDAIIQDQTFSTLVIPAQALNTLEHGETTMDKVIELGTKRVFAYDAEGGKGPEYISPDPSQVEVILSVITKIITEIYHSVGMAGERTKMDSGAGIDNSSGVAKAYDFDRMNTMLKAKADTLQYVENELCNLVLLWHGEALPKESMVKYADEFDVRNLYDEFDVANRLSLLDAPDEVRRHQMIQLVEKLFPNIGSDLKEKIAKQVKEDWPPEEAISLRAPSRLQDRTVEPQNNRQGQDNGQQNPEQN